MCAATAVYHDLLKKQQRKHSWEHRRLCTADICDIISKFMNFIAVHELRRESSFFQHSTCMMIEKNLATMDMMEKVHSLTNTH